MGMQFRTANTAPETTERQRLDDFEIVAEVDEDGEPTRVEQFVLYRPSDSASLMALNLAARFHENASTEVKRQAISAAVDFLGACMEPGQYQTFYELLVSPSFGMDQEQIVALCKWAIESVGKGLSPRSGGSARGRSTTGRKSTAAARSKR